MRHTFVVLVLFACSFSNITGQAQRTATPLLGPPTVDRRVELLSIVARMAGFSEYSDSSNRPYVNLMKASENKMLTRRDATGSLGPGP